jgi:hypothetical protein
MPPSDEDALEGKAAADGSGLTRPPAASDCGMMEATCAAGFSVWLRIEEIACRRFLNI